MANRCKYCNKKVDGVSVCNCSERARYEKLWAKPPRCKDMKEEWRNRNKDKLEKKKK